MPAPTTYSEAELRLYMVERLSDVATILGWTGASVPVSRAVWAAERSYRSAVAEITDVSDATDMPKLEAIAEREAWRAAVGALAARVNIGGAGTSTSLSQQFDHAKEMLAQAESECMALGIGQGGAYAITVTPVVHTEDPYVIQVEDEALA